MVRLADDDRLPPLLLRLSHQLLNAADIGAGGIDAADAPALQTVQHAFQLSVGADDHCVSGAQLLAARRFPDTPPGQILHHIAVVDQIPQHPATAGLLRRFLRQVHGPLDAVAESGALRKNHLHRGSPPTVWPPRA